MRKFLTALVVVALLATSVLLVACQNNDTSSFSYILNQMQKAGKIEMDCNKSQTGTFINSITYDGLKMGDPDAYQYVLLYINTNDEKLIDLSGWMGNYDYNGETFYPSGVGIDLLTYSAGMKLLVVYTAANTEGKYVPAAGDALLFTVSEDISDKAKLGETTTIEKVTLD